MKRKDEMMAWVLCAVIHGPAFDQTLPRVGQIVAERNYDRSVLLTELATEGVKKRGPRP